MIHHLRFHERDLADLIADLESAYATSRSRDIRVVVRAAADYLWRLRCELMEQGG
jgi:hypothetical protein